MADCKLSDIEGLSPLDYPFELEAKYRRIADRIAALWGTAELDLYFDDLVIDRRGRRIGFSREVMRELVTLLRLWERAKAGDLPMRPSKAVLEARAALEELQVKPTDEALRAAIDANDPVMVQLLLDAGMYVNAADAEGWTPLIRAAYAGHESLVITLLGRLANPNATDPEGYTPLHWAAHLGTRLAARELIRKGAVVDARNRTGRTPLMLAAARGHALLAGVLVSNGASVRLRDESGRSAIDDARANGHQSLAAGLADRTEARAPRVDSAPSLQAATR